MAPELSCELRARALGQAAVWTPPRTGPKATGRRDLKRREECIMREATNLLAMRFSRRQEVCSMLPLLGFERRRAAGRWPLAAGCWVWSRGT